MDSPGTAIEQFFNHLIHMRLLSQVVLSDRQGNTILTCFGPPPLSVIPSPSDQLDGGYGTPDGDITADGLGDEEGPMESNVVLSGARCFQSMDQLHLGQPAYISAQYHDAVVVQSLEKCCLLTLIGTRSHGHCVGGLLGLLPQIRRSPVYAELVAKVEDCFR